MSKENENDLQKSADKKLAAEKLEDASAGATEQVEDESTGSARGRLPSKMINTTEEDLTMKKLMIGEKEIAIDENTIQQLSDDELEYACGGSGTGGESYFRLVCDQCNFKSWWYPQKAKQIYSVDLHKQRGCNGILRDEHQCFEFDPNLIAD